MLQIIYLCIVVVMFRLLQEKFSISGTATAVYRVNNSAGVFQLMVSGNAIFFLLSKLSVSLEISLK